MDELLECRRVSSGLLRDASFDLAPGEIAAVLGDADPGAEVLRRILEGTAKDYSGQILIRGRQVRLRSVAQVQNFGIFSIGHEGILLPNMTVYENIGVLNGLDRKGPLIRKKWARKQAAYLLERFGIQVSLEALPEELTAYQRHEVEMLKAIGCGASLLIFSGFFEEYSQEERALLADRWRYLTRLGISVLVLLEKPYVEWGTLFDRIVFMERGVSGVSLVGGACADAMEQRSRLRPAPAKGPFPQERHGPGGAQAAIIDARTGGRLAAVSKGDVIGVLDAGRIFPRRVDEAEGWLERNIRIRVQGALYSPQELKRQGRRIEIVCGHFGASPVLEGWSIAENVSFSACRTYSRSGMVHRRVADYIARRTLQSAAFFGPLLEHWDEQDCAALDESCCQRLETARAFAAMPDAVIFAHAASQLDTKETEELHTLIRDSARRRDRVYIVIESDTHELTQLGADELCRLS